MLARTSSPKWAALLFVGLIVFWMSSSLGGQEQPPPAKNPPAEGTAPEDVDSASDDSILGMIMGSGVTGVLFMAVLGLFSVVATTVAVERAVHLRKDRVLPNQFLDRLKEISSQPHGVGQSLQSLCEEVDAPVSRIVAVGLTRQGASIMEVEKSMEDAAAREMAELRARIRPLSTVGGVAPLVGLLGTVVGMIIAFHTASQTGLGKAELLAKGIYMALLTTAGGLSVAIPSLLLASFFNGRIEKYFRQMDKSLTELVPKMAHSETPQPSPQQPQRQPDSENRGPATRRKERNPLASVEV